MTEIFSGNNVEEAKAAASAKFGVPVSEITFEIIEEGKKGFLGIGKVDAKVKASYENKSADKAAEVAEKPASSPAPTASAQPSASPASKMAADSPISEKTSEISAEQKCSPVTAEKSSTASNTSDSEDEDYSLDNFTLIEDDSLLNPKVRIASDYIKSLLNAMQIKSELKIYQNSSAAVIDIVSDANGTIIGRRGETLDAIQYLSSMISNKGDKDYFRITIDCFGYRAKRKVTLQQLAEKVAKSVLRTGRAQPLEPMNPYERRVIHSAIAKIEGVSSRSVGEEPYRKIIISSINAKHYDRKSGSGDRRDSNQHRRFPNDRNDRRTERPHDTVREAKPVDLSTSFEKDYKRPKPEDSIEGGLYGKIEF